MTKRKRGVGLGVSLVVSLAAPLLIGAIAAACGSSASSGPGGTGGGKASSTGSMGTGGNGTGMAQSTASSGSGGMGGAMPMPCKGDADCANNPAGKVCDTTTGNCVGCLPANDKCPSGEYCDPATNDCSMGCKGDPDCVGANTHCDPQTHVCVGCLMDNDCPLGTLCGGGICAAGCTPAHGCMGSDTCCNGACADLSTSLGNCGACGKLCPVPDNSVPTCINGMCGQGACNNGWANCDTLSNNGCEWNILLDGPCACVPGATQPCYNGAPGTKGVGPCKAGTTTCNAMGTGWGACVGEVLPQPEACNSLVDLDCDGTPGNVPDVDGDGWTACNGDCCETIGQCPSPALVNPGAFEVLNNGINDDCDAATSDTVAPAPCSTVQKFSGVTALDIAKAMDICQTTTANAPLPTKKWGLISQAQLLADGTVPLASDLANIQNFQNAVLQNFGTGGILPHKAATMAGMSSGAMRDANDPGWVLPIGGSSYFTSIAFAGAGAPLGTYVNAHGGGLLPGSCAGAPCPVGSGANDSSNVRLVIRVPTNAKSFSYDFRFFSAEYQSFQCTSFNDYYLAMLTSGVAGIPADHNISFDANNNAVSVNNGFFQVCGGNGKNCGPCPNGTAELTGTGMDQVMGGGTAWLTTDAPIVPGETMTLELVIFDVSDHIYDSLVLLDNFRWNLAPAVVNTHQ